MRAITSAASPPASAPATPTVSRPRCCGPSVDPAGADDGPVTDPDWTVHDVSLEDLILGYLAETQTQGSYTAWGVTA
jgi:hypothetical protein